MQVLHHGRAPARIGLAGGGTDLAAFADIHGGAVVNTTISRYATATVAPRDDGKIELISHQQEPHVRVFPRAGVQLGADFALPMATIRRVKQTWGLGEIGLTLTTKVDAPPGSGLGSSSALVVAILGALAQWQGIELDAHQVAELAYDIERSDLGITCGRQDQYAAAHGGFNLMEFSRGGVLVTPLDLSTETQDDVAEQLLLFDTGTSRKSGDVISDQLDRIGSNNHNEQKAMHDLRRLAYRVRDSLENGGAAEVGRILNFGMERKLRSSEMVGANGIEPLYRGALERGADGGKVSGAGGGGFLVLTCPASARATVTSWMISQGCTPFDVALTPSGLDTWTSTG